MFDAKVIAVGNPGSGKSTFLNALAGENLFNSGVSIGKGLTYQLDERINARGTFLDTPGLADEKLREAAGKAISNGLRKGGDFKVIFFVTQQAGRVNAQDATTMRLVLEAASDIDQNYGVIINKVKRRTIDRFKNEDDRTEFLLSLFAGIPEDKRCVFDHVMFFPEKEELDELKNVLVSPKDLVSDKGKNLAEFISEDVPTIIVKEENVQEINTKGFDELNKKLEQMAREMQEKDDEWKKKLIQLEKKRNEDLVLAKLDAKLDAKIELLENNKNKLDKVGPVAKQIEQIKDQKRDINAISEAIDPSFFSEVKKAAEKILETASNVEDPLVKNIKEKKDRLEEFFKLQSLTDQLKQQIDAEFAKFKLEDCDLLLFESNGPAAEYQGNMCFEPSP